MKTDLDTLIDVALAAQASEPASTRIKILRAAATLVSSPTDSEHLLKLAAELEAVDQRCFAFARQLRQAPLFTETTHGGTKA